MADKPIIFSAPMVRALLDGRKTQTRRVLKINWKAGANQNFTGWRSERVGQRHWQLIGGLGVGADIRTAFATGDRLWVREAFTTCEKHKFMVAYRADGECGAWCWDGDGKPIFIHHGHVVEASPRGQWGFARYGGRWRSPIHMPRWASRLTLTVTEVRVQRLQEISEADVVAEGVDGKWSDASDDAVYITPNERFCGLWNSLHGTEAWDANPWVAAYSFTVQRGNIDAIKETSNG